MLRKLATMVGYAKAPKATFVMRHPIQGTKALIAAKGAKKLARTRAGVALGALVALPVAALAVRRMGHSEG